MLGVALPLSETVRAPRLLVLADGEAVPGAMEAEVIGTSHYAADRFRVRVALGAAPGVASAWADAEDTMLDIRMSLQAGGPWVSLVQGAVDSVAIDAVADTLVLEGRDLTAALIETRTQETFANRTSSEIATLLAGRHGLTADVQVTTTPVGRYWQLQHDRITLDAFCRATTEWDLLVTLARVEGCEVWMTGKVLHFRPVPAQTIPSMVLRAAATASGAPNVTELHLERALTLARDIEVTVKSWHSRAGQAYTQTAKSVHAKKESGKVQRYVYVVPNLTPEQALALAQQRLVELSQHERVVTAAMPGELTLAPRMLVRVEGTGTSFDQNYWVHEVSRQLSPAGFTQRVLARNLSAES
jgi:phage protein D